jgi:hypothetical protein
MSAFSFDVVQPILLAGCLPLVPHGFGVVVSVLLSIQAAECSVNAVYFCSGISLNNA